MTVTQIGTTNIVDLSSEEVSTNPYNGPFTIMEIPRIDPTEKALWLEALDSETYKDKQGKNALKTPNGNFCCLGVYCDAKHMPFEIKQGIYTEADTRERVEANMTYYGQGTHANSSIIPFDRAIPWADKQSTDTCLSWGNGFTGDEDLFHCVGQDGKDTLGYGTSWCLPKLNDEGFTFAQIADIINYFL